MSGAPEELLSRTLRSTLDLERLTAARVAQQLAEARELLRQVAAEERARERHHLADGNVAYAASHAALAERIEAHLAEPAPTTTRARQEGAPFQSRVLPWLHLCFGPEIAADKVERNHRFLEEALELVQATGCTQAEAHQLVDYVFGRESGDAAQEVGGVMNTLAALCLAHGMDMHEAGERELARVNLPEMVLKIRAKQQAKPKHSPLPGGA